MLIHALTLAFSFLVILAGAEMFTNGIEWAGSKFQISEAAVGTCLPLLAPPETFVPAVALLTGREDPRAHSAVGVGAIIGAPLMLSTLALFVMGMAGLASRKRRDQIALRVSPADVRRDLYFFFPVFLAILLLGLLHLPPVVRQVSAVILLGIYGCYSFVMLRIKRALVSNWNMVSISRRFFAATRQSRPYLRPFPK